MALNSKNSADDIAPGPIAWINGRYLAASAASLPLSDLGLQGLAVTEMVRTYDHNIFRLNDHIRRLRESLQACAIECDIVGLEEVSQTIARRNSSFVASDSDIGLIMFVTAGPNPTYVSDELKPTVCVHTFELPLWKWTSKIQDGIELAISKVLQLPASSMPAHAKSRSRMHWHLANKDVHRRNPNAQAVLLDHDGLLTETATANLFAVFEDTVVTPAANVLPGISRKVVSELCSVLGLQYEERSLRPEEIESADELFVSSTPYGLLPVTKFEGTIVANGRPGPIFFELCNAWSELVGIDIIEQIVSAAE
ncbi:MAG: aminotransferase class IV [Planctomycetaceae bacterium]